MIANQYQSIIINNQPNYVCWSFSGCPSSWKKSLLTSALCAQDLLGTLGCFLDACYNLQHLTTSYNQCLPCNQVLQSRWKICGQNSGTHRGTNERRQTNAAAKLHNSFATPLVVLRLSRKAEQQNCDPKDLVTPMPIPIGSQKVLQICGTFWQGTSRSDKTELVNRDAGNFSDIN